MNTSTIKSINDLPRDIAILHPMLWALIQENRLLEDHLKLLKKDIFGKKSEKQVDPDDTQLVLEGLLEQITQTQPSKEETFVEVKAATRRKKHPGRNAIPENITTIEHVIDLLPEEKTCTTCSKDLTLFRKETRTVIERVPATYEKHVYITNTYVCTKCKDTVFSPDAPLVNPFPRLLAGPKLLLFVILSKYQYHLPLYRIQRQIFHESAIWFTRATMAGWIEKVCVPLERIYQEMIDSLKMSSCIHADESLVKRSDHTSYMWVYVNGMQTIAIYDYKETRASTAPMKFLEGVAPETRLMIDGYAAYNKPVKAYSLIAMACMMHIRREFVEAAEVGSEKEYALRIVRLIGQLYRIERFATVKNLSDENRYEIREKFSSAIMDKIYKALTSTPFVLLPQNRITKAINYARNQWPRAKEFLERGNLPIDNGVCERVIRDLAIGRKNWLFVQSEDGGKRMAILYSIIATCKLNKINPEEYLGDVLMRIAMRPDTLPVTDLQPIEWYKARNNGNLPGKEPLYPSVN